MSADLIFHRVFKLSRFTSSLKYFKPSLVFPSRVSAVSISFSTETRAPEATHYRWSFQFGWMDSRAIDGVAFHRPHALFSECLQVELLTSGVSQHISHVKCVHYILERACWCALYLAAIPPTPTPLSLLACIVDVSSIVLSSTRLSPGMNDLAALTLKKVCCSWKGFF